MSGYGVTANIEKVEWNSAKQYGEFFAVAVLVAIPADEFTGLDITRPITITQEAP